MKGIMLQVADDLHAEMVKAKNGDSFQTWIEKAIRAFLKREGQPCS